MILKKEAFLFVDGRYTLQAQKEIKKGIKDLDNGKRISYESFLEKIS